MSVVLPDLMKAFQKRDGGYDPAILGKRPLIKRKFTIDIPTHSAAFETYRFRIIVCRAMIRRIDIRLNKFPIAGILYKPEK